MYQLNSIGKIKLDKENIVISVDGKFVKALKHLNQFSHVHVFYAYKHCEGWGLNKTIARIQEVDLKKGVVSVNPTKNLLEEGDLLDLKPYFPCEDSVKAIIPPSGDSGCPIELVKTDSENGYRLDAIGMIRNVKGNIYIQLNHPMDVESKYIKIYWWFHKYDTKKFRQATQCNPPYEDAPRTGIFATRSPVRPNPIAMTIAKVQKVDLKEKRIYISGIESFDKTPCIGISPYGSEEDCIRECQVPEWLSHWPQCLDESNQNSDLQEIAIKESGLEALLRADSKAIDEKPSGNLSIHSENKIEEGIVVLGARENNLKGINLKVPYRKITAVVGVSGSGKSSLVHDTIYAECRRRMEYLNHGRNVLQKPKVEKITGCIPTVIISQEAIRGNSLSTVGTYTNSYDYLRVIYASVSIRHCPNCGNEIIPMSRDKILAFLLRQKEVQVYDLLKQKIVSESIEKEVDIALIRGKGAFYIRLSQGDFLLLQTKQKCFQCNHLMFEMTPMTFSYIDGDSRCSVCNGTGKVFEIDDNKIIEHPNLSLLDGASPFYGKLRNFANNPNANWTKGQVIALAKEMNVDLEMSWITLPGEYREILLKGSKEKVVTFNYYNKKNGRKGEITRPVEGIYEFIERFQEDSSDTNSFDKYMKKSTCRSCEGERLNNEGRMATINHIRYSDTAGMSFYEMLDFCYELEHKLSRSDIQKIETPIYSLKEIAQTAINLGLGYVKLSQETSTLSGGEGQRLKLLGATINHMTGILYIFDEPSKGLHPHDYSKVIDMLHNLKEQGNTIMMVEHNEDMIKVADYIVEIGPGAGEGGGMLVGEGTLEAMMSYKGTQINKYLNPINTLRMPYIKQDIQNKSFIEMKSLNYGNLKDISVRFPRNALTCICGVSGSGKSSLMKGEIYNKTKSRKDFAEVILVDQLPIGKNSKSIIATYVGIMNLIRSVFSGTDYATNNYLNERYFSFNNEIGQCQNCKGEGRVKLKYLEDAFIQCPDCKGKRYKKPVLKACFKGKNIDEVLNMSVEEALAFWEQSEDVTRVLSSLKRVGLGYLKLGQGTASLSGGEASRLKLAKELISKRKRNGLYLLDEPTTGLHFSDIDHLLRLVSELICSGNTVITIEHNKQFWHSCDWCIELGPGAGEAGGEVVRIGKL